MIFKVDFLENETPYKKKKKILVYTFNPRLEPEKNFILSYPAYPASLYGDFCTINKTISRATASTYTDRNDNKCREYLHNPRWDPTGPSFRKVT